MSTSKDLLDLLNAGEDPEKIFDSLVTAIEDEPPAERNMLLEIALMVTIRCSRAHIEKYLELQSKYGQWSDEDVATVRDVGLLRLATGAAFYRMDAKLVEIYEAMSGETIPDAYFEKRRTILTDVVGILEGSKATVDKEYAFPGDKAALDPLEDYLFFLVGNKA